MAKKEIVTYSQQTFENIKRTDENGAEFWYARELQKALEYTEYGKLIIPERRSRQSGKMGATIPDLESHLFIVLLFGQIQRVVVARDFISLFARAACLQAA